MILYFIKSTLCAAILFAPYKLLFERESMHHFKRFYLLVSLIISFIIPTVIFPSYPGNTVSTIVSTVSPLSNIIIADDQLIILPNQSTASSPVSWQSLITGIYLLITLVLLLRFLHSLYRLYLNKKAAEIIIQTEATLVLTDDNAIPHSVFNYIFINKTAYANGELEPEILLHELAHVRQRHTWDVMTIHFLQIVFWFNPVLFFYRKAIQLNHEFLADQYVIKQSNNIAAYQYLLIDKANSKQSFSFTSQLNYSLTKKRLLMMTQSTSKQLALLKQLALIPTFLTCVLFCSKETFGQKDPVKKQQQVTNKQPTSTTVKKDVPTVVTNTGKAAIFEKNVPFTTEGVSQKELDEYAAIVNKNKTTGAGFSATEKSKLESIYKRMNREQQAAQSARFIASASPLAKVVPTTEEFVSFKNDKVYGVWIDHKKVSNSELDKYTNTDFSQVYISKLYGAAAKGRSYTHQLNLMTNDFYATYYKNAMANMNSLIMVITHKTNS